MKALTCGGFGCPRIWPDLPNKFRKEAKVTERTHREVGVPRMKAIGVRIVVCAFMLLAYLGCIQSRMRETQAIDMSLRQCVERLSSSESNSSRTNSLYYGKVLGYRYSDVEKPSGDFQVCLRNASTLKEELSKHLGSDNINLARNCALILLLMNDDEVILSNLEQLVLSRDSEIRAYAHEYLTGGMYAPCFEGKYWPEESLDKLCQALTEFVDKGRLDAELAFKVGWTSRNLPCLDYMVRNMDRHHEVGVLNLGILDSYVPGAMDMEVSEIEEWWSGNKGKKRYQWLCDRLNKEVRTQWDFVVDSTQISDYYLFLVYLLDDKDNEERAWMAKEVLVEVTGKRDYRFNLLPAATYRDGTVGPARKRWVLWCLQERPSFPLQRLPASLKQSTILRKFIGDIEGSTSLVEEYGDAVDKAIKRTIRQLEEEETE